MTSITTCPACNYTRQPTDDAPDWECPNCQRAYIKTAHIVHHQEAENLPEFTNKLEPPVSTAIGFVIVGIAVLATLFFSIKVGSAFLFIWQMAPCILAVYSLIRYSKTKSIVIFNCVAFFIISGASIYCSYDIIYIHPDPQGGIGLFLLPILQLLAYGVLALVYVGATSFRIK